MHLLTTASPVSNICKSRNVWVTHACSHIFTVENFSNSYVSHPLWKAGAFVFPRVSLLSSVFLANFECLPPPPLNVLVARQIHGGKREALRKRSFHVVVFLFPLSKVITTPLSWRLNYHIQICVTGRLVCVTESPLYGVAGTNRCIGVLILYGIWDTVSPLSTYTAVR